MSKVCLTAALFLATAGSATAQNWANKMLGGNPNAPILQDFGTVARGTQMEKEFPLTNIYKVPLNVTDIRVSCQCTAAEAYKLVGGQKIMLHPGGPALQPNETATLLVKMDGSRWPGGPKSVNVFVTFGPQFVSTANLVVSANLKQDVVLEPGNIDFGSVQRGSPIEKSIKVECFGKPNWQVVQVVKNVNAPFDLRSEVLPARNVNGLLVTGYRLTATMRPGANPGPFRESVDLQTNDEAKKISFVVEGTVMPPVTVVPNPVQVAGLKLGNAFNTKIVVTANQPFRIIGMTNNGGDVKLAAVPDRAAPTHVLDLSVFPTVPGLLNREIILQTDMRNETVKVIVQGNVAP